MIDSLDINLYKNYLGIVGSSCTKGYQGETEMGRYDGPFPIDPFCGSDGGRRIHILRFVRIDRR